MINTTGPLDRETVSLYHLNLIAEDGGDPPNRAFASLLIIVQDINDNPPVFNPTEYIVTLTENVDYPSFIVLLVSVCTGIGSGRVVWWSQVAAKLHI